MFTFPTIDMIKTGHNIMQLRIKNGFTVRDIQNVFGFTSPQAIYKWQHGMSMPTLDNLVVLSALFQVHIEDILVINKDITIKMSA